MSHTVVHHSFYYFKSSTSYPILTTKFIYITGHIFGPGDIVASIEDVPFSIGSSRARMSFIYVQNCATAHILTALALKRGASLPSPLNVEERVAGNAFFISDFDENFCKLYKLLANRPQAHFRIPTWFFVMIVLIAEFVDHILFYCFNYNNLQHPVTGISRGMWEACEYLTCVSIKSRSLLNYRQHSGQGADGISKQIYPYIVSKEEAIKRTVNWSESKTRVVSIYD